MGLQWSQKAIHRLIVSSATYRQSSDCRPEGPTIDPAIVYCGGKPASAWTPSYRDAALTASDLLTPVLGGPSVFPPQPEGVMTLGQMNRPWQADSGPNRYRRGLYTFFWRATPHPFLTTFDAALRHTDLHAPVPIQHAVTGSDDAQRPGIFRVRRRTGGADIERAAGPSLGPRPAPAWDHASSRPAAADSELDKLENLLAQARDGLGPEPLVLVRRPIGRPATESLASCELGHRGPRVAEPL